MSEIIIYGNELYHHGIKGQKWGIRRYQNEDGTLTAEGRNRYGYGVGKKNYSKQEWKNVKSEMAKKESEYKKKYQDNTAEERDKLNKRLNRTKAAYYKTHNDFKDYNDGSNIGKAVYKLATRKDEEAYTKAMKDYKDYENRGKEYVSSSMKKRFGQDYDDWNREAETTASIVVGTTFVAAYAGMYLLTKWLNS